PTPPPGVPPYMPPSASGPVTSLPRPTRAPGPQPAGPGAPGSYAAGPHAPGPYGPAPHTPAGQATAVASYPRAPGLPPAPPPGPLTVAMREFWAARLAPVPTPVLVAAGVAGVVGGGLVVGHEPGLGMALVGALVWSAALPALVRRRAVGELVTAALAIA